MYTQCLIRQVSSPDETPLLSAALHAQTAGNGASNASAQQTGTAKTCSVDFCVIHMSCRGRVCTGALSAVSGVRCCLSCPGLHAHNDRCTGAIPPPGKLLATDLIAGFSAPLSWTRPTFTFIASHQTLQTALVRSSLSSPPAFPEAFEPRALSNRWGEGACVLSRSRGCNWLLGGTAAGSQLAWMRQRGWRWSPAAPLH
jgi:hypothetical protein